MPDSLTDRARTVSIGQGQYSGLPKGHHIAFLSIPYALPPIGGRRFAPPVKIPNGDEDRPADRFGPACPQVAGRIRCAKGHADDQYSEDCLKLNIYTPAVDGSRRPVMVWVHGGAFKLGSSNVYDGGPLCELGDIVIVTINYRLGVFGFVDIGRVTGTEVPGNLGLRDIVAALEWVRDNIAAFGGAPNQVTVAGESAGSIAISLLMVADQAKGLFRGAILQSGGLNLIHDRGMAAQTAEAYKTVLGSPSIDHLRSMSDRALLEAQTSAARLLGGATPCSPWYDGDFLPGSLDAAHSKPAHKIPMLAGYNREETALFEKMPKLLSVPVHRKFLEEQLLRDLGKDQTAAILSAYTDDAIGSRLLATDLYFSMGMINMLERHTDHSPCWHYRFDYRHWWLGAAHGLELLFLWHFKGPLAAFGRGGFLTGRRRALADRLRQYWINFVRNGEPGLDWSQYECTERQTMLLDTDCRIASDPAEHTRKVWQGKDITPRAFT